MSTKTIDKGDAMLKLSTKGRYGLRAMIDLAYGYGGPPIMMSEIAERQGLSRKYLHALLTSLRSAGLVVAKRGAKGGYTLAMNPEKIQVSTIFNILEGKVSIVECVSDSDACSRIETCETRDLWKALNSALINVLSGTTLNDLLKNKTKEGVVAPEPCVSVPETKKGRQKE
jgi:Rrf2 family transcriptional regulator, cysteine metabolism repressor